MPETEPRTEIETKVSKLEKRVSELESDLHFCFQDGNIQTVKESLQRVFDLHKESQGQYKELRRELVRGTQKFERIEGTLQDKTRVDEQHREELKEVREDYKTFKKEITEKFDKVDDKFDNVDAKILENRNLFQANFDEIIKGQVPPWLWKLIFIVILGGAAKFLIFGTP